MHTKKHIPLFWVSRKSVLIMAKKSNKLGVAAGAAAIVVKKAKSTEKSEVKKAPVSNNGYRNTERGKYEKNAYIVGSGLASLAAACFLVRDGQMPGSHIHILEAMDIAGGACDGIFDSSRGYVMRGGREMENHFECLWDLFRSIPSLETPGASVLDEFYWLNKHDPNYSLCRATVNRGEDAHTDGRFQLFPSEPGQKQYESYHCSGNCIFVTGDRRLAGRNHCRIWTSGYHEYGNGAGHAECAGGNRSFAGKIFLKTLQKKHGKVKISQF